MNVQCEVLLQHKHKKLKFNKVKAFNQDIVIS